MKDFLGNELKVGDSIIFIAPKYRDFAKGTVTGASKTEKTIYITYVNTWNYPPPREDSFYAQHSHVCHIKQTPHQVIVVPKEKIDVRS